MVEIKTLTIPDSAPNRKLQLPPGKRHDLNTEQMRQAIEELAQEMANKGWTLRAHGSRGGAMYCTFARKKKG